MGRQRRWQDYRVRSSCNPACDEQADRGPPFLFRAWAYRHLFSSASTINPTTGKVITSFSAGSKKDVDLAVAAAEEAYTERWGEKVAGHARGVILQRLAALIDENADELAALESLDNGKAYSIARAFDVSEAAACLRYYAGWADKDGGKVIEVDDSKFA